MCFVDNIATIRSNLATIRQSLIEKANKYHDSQCESTLSEFSPVTEQDVRKLIKKSASKACSLDPIPMWLVKRCMGPLLPVITKIINLSLSTSQMPEKLKDTILSPIIKIKKPSWIVRFSRILVLCQIHL